MTYEQQLAKVKRQLEHYNELVNMLYLLKIKLEQEMSK